MLTGILLHMRCERILHLRITCPSRELNYSMSEYQTISQIMQAAVSPVFLLAGVGALLNVLSGLLGRIIDRLRFLQRYIDLTEGED